MVTGHLFMNFGLSCLLQTEFILEQSAKEAMTLPYLALSGGLFLIFSAGYLAWIPTIDEAEYALGIVGTNTNMFWFITVNLYRLGLLAYIIIKYYLIGKKAKGVTKKKMSIFTYSLIVAVVGIVFNLAAGVIFGNWAYVEYSFEIAGMLTFVIGLVLMLRAFMLKERIEQN